MIISKEQFGGTMQAVINKIENTSSIQHFLTRLESADNTTKNEIENMLVNIGKSAVPELVSQLQVIKGVKRGVVAMTLIRIGADSVEPLRAAARDNEDFAWVAKYLITEINCEMAA
jgi:hypothetical protein